MLNMTRLLDLPDELIVNITTFLHPSTHLKFALTCTRCLVCSQEGLQLHAEYHRRYHVVEGVQPHALYDSLRDVLEDDMAAWHVRSLKVANEPRMYYIPDAEYEARRHDHLSYLLARHLKLDDIYSRELSREEPGEDGTPAMALLLACCPRIECSTVAVFGMRHRSKQELSMCISL